MIRIVIAACLIFPASAGETPSARQELEELAPEEQTVPEPGISGPVEPPEDLVQARERFGGTAQIDAIGRRSPAPKTEFSFAVIGDTEKGRFFFERWWSPGKDAFKRQLASMTARDPDFVMQLGDSVSKGTIKNYRKYVSFLKKYLKIPLVHVIGNHDRSKPNGKADKVLFKATFGETDLYFDHNGWRFVALDSSDYAVTDAQLDWLDKALDTPNKTLIFTHIVPSYLKGKIKSKVPRKVEAKLLPKGYFAGGSARFGKIVKKRGVERVYMGHIHAYGTAVHGGVKYVLSGGGGSPLYPLPPGYPKFKPAHYIWVEAGPGGLKETVHVMDGATFPVIF